MRFCRPGTPQAGSWHVNEIAGGPKAGALSALPERALKRLNRRDQPIDAGLGVAEEHGGFWILI